MKQTPFFQTNSRYIDGVQEIIMSWKTSDGCRVVLEVQDMKEWIKDAKKPIWTVSLHISKKNRGFKEGEQTGSGSLEGLYAAKVMLEDFIDCLEKGEQVYIWATDKRRLAIYERWLSPIGFEKIIFGKGISKTYLKYEKND